MDLRVTDVGGEVTSLSRTEKERTDEVFEHRKHDLDYKTALEKGLPIGSGEIESAHRYVIQERLKLPGV